MDDNWLDDESDDRDNAHAEDSGSETENIDSETTEDEEEIDLEKPNLEESDPGGNDTQGCSYSSRSDMVWSSTPSYSSATKHHGNVKLTPGSTELTSHVASVEDAFLCFILEEITLDDSFEEISMVELKGFIGLLLISGLRGKSRKSIKSLWARSPLESPVFRATMSRNRFETIASCLRFDDKTTREERKNTDKFAAIREIWSDFQNYLYKCYSVGYFVTIDEQLVGFRGKCPFRQFIPKKPDKYGIKLWLCVDAYSYYVYDAVPYTGQQPGQDRQKNIGVNIVLQLMKLLFGSDEIELGELLLNRYCEQAAIIYDDKSIEILSLHAHFHLAQQVRAHNGFAFTSAFAFESCIRFIKKKAHGSNYGKFP
ncbi:unnamed protein product [Didymodactylos carnosus]|uniref:PiggyBac transposable element-derived protein domain-containing protein n=1 Tax=Didymodactylos carnosus TaxID=1234261 RepID=A0A8S2E744_9BILA|nr:unnamed protein product [Didymodactylos carnosus]CAF3957215.1 unnamed protein product [Didymodactylos carnosus]